MDERTAEPLLSEDPPERWTSFDERVRELFLDYGLTDQTSFTYTWDRGAESYDYENHELNSGSHYSGIFHPRDGLCIGNPCDYCGRVTSYD